MRSYTYKDVPEEAYAAMEAASSKCVFLNAHIRDRLEFDGDEVTV